MAKKNKVQKEKQLESFGDNIRAKLKLDCTLCNNSFVEDYEEGGIDDYASVRHEFAVKAYKEGWRLSASSVFGSTGIHCPECHEHRNNKKHFE